MKNNLKLCAKCAKFYSQGFNVRMSNPKAGATKEICDHCEKETYCMAYEIAGKK